MEGLLITIYQSAYYSAVLLVLILCLLFRKQLIFGLSCLYIFYLFPISVLFARISSYDDTHLFNKKCWSRHIVWFLNIEMVKIPGSRPLYVNKSNNTIVLFNHRSFADFFVHDLVVGHSCSILSRYMVALVFPIIWITTSFYNSIWFFKRGKSNLRKLFQWMDNQFGSKMTARKSLIIYPEGHRNLGVDPLPLKHGIIKYSFERNYQTQIIVAMGLEHCINEKKFTLNFSNNVINYLIVDPIFPQCYPTFDEYKEKIEDKFAEAFYTVRNFTEQTNTILVD